MQVLIFKELQVLDVGTSGFGPRGQYTAKKRKSKYRQETKSAYRQETKSIYRQETEIKTPPRNGNQVCEWPVNMHAMDI